MLPRRNRAIIEQILDQLLPQILASPGASVEEEVQFGRREQLRQQLFEGQDEQRVSHQGQDNPAPGARLMRPGGAA